MWDGVGCGGKVKLSEVTLWATNNNVRGGWNKDLANARFRASSTRYVSQA